MTDSASPLLLAGVFLINDQNEICLLYRKDHHHYETPGGKVEKRDYPELAEPSFESIKRAAERELEEELGTMFTHSELVYFGAVDFKIPNGRRALATKFLSKFEEGTPTLKEPETFEHFRFIPIERLNEYALSSDLRLFLPRLQSYFKR